MNHYQHDGHQQGLTLVELIIAIAVLGVTMAGLMTAYTSLVMRSSDPMINQQSLAIADSFMEEIMSKAFPPSFSGTCPAAPANRELYDDVCDYSGYSATTIADVAGNDLGITGYNVSVVVSAAGGDLGLSTNSAVSINVTVGNPLGSSVSISSYRTAY